MEPRRSPGRPRNGNGGTVAVLPSKPETAVQHLVRLQSMRDAGNGYILAPPPGIQHAQLVEPKDFEDRVIVGQLVRNEPMKQALAHMRALAEVGSPGDLTLFWETWHPLTQSATVNPKYNLTPDYQQLVKEAGRRHEVLVARAEDEQRPAKVVAECRRNLQQAEARLEAERRRYLGPAEAEVARAKALLASAEATLKEAA